MTVIKITGIELTMSRLRSLDRGVRRRVLRKAANAGGTVGVKRIKSLAPKKNRGLSKSITKKVKTYSKTGTVVLIMGQDMKKVGKAGSAAKKSTKGGGISGRGNTVPSHLIENPTRAHDMPGRTRRGVFTAGDPMEFLNRFWAGGGSPVFTRSIRHPGTPGQYFIRRASQSGRGVIAKTIETKLTVETLREAGKARAAS